MVNQTKIDDIDELYPWKTQYNANRYVPWTESITMPSVTVPDMALTVEEAVQRFTRGLPVSGMSFPIYENDDADTMDMQFMSKMDLVEQRVYYEDQLEQLEKRRQARVKAIKDKNEADKNRQIKELEEQLKAVKGAVSEAKEPKPGL